MSDIIPVPDDDLEILDADDLIISANNDESGLIQPVWEIQAESLGETIEDYTLFLIYAGLPPSDRSVQQTWQQWSGRKTKISQTFWAKSKKFMWAHRAASWDIAKLRAVQNDWVQRDERRRDEDFSVADIMRLLAKEKLETISGEDLSVNQAIHMLEVASRLQTDAIPDIRLNDTEIKQVLSSLPDERRKNIINILIAKIGS